MYDITNKRNNENIMSKDGDAIELERMAAGSGTHIISWSRVFSDFYPSDVVSLSAKFPPLVHVDSRHCHTVNGGVNDPP